MAPDKGHPPKKSYRAKKGAHPLIPYDEFLAEAKRLRDLALKTLVTDGVHGPILILWTGDLGMEVAGLQVSDDRPLHEHVKAVVQARGARAFVCISEAWMVQGPDAQASLAANIRPSRHPERREVLAISAIHPEGTAGWFVPFAREAGRIVLGTPVDSTGMTLGGGIPEALAKGEEG